MERQLIHSLVGQSEILSLSGVYLLTQGQNVFGSLMLAAGVLGGLCRFMLNFQMISQNMKNESIEEQEDEKFARILSEISKQ